jgi:hypothetical protein
VWPRPPAPPSGYLVRPLQQFERAGGKTGRSVQLSLDWSISKMAFSLAASQNRPQNPMSSGMPSHSHMEFWSMNRRPERAEWAGASWSRATAGACRACRATSRSPSHRLCRKIWILQHRSNWCHDFKWPSRVPAFVPRAGLSLGRFIGLDRRGSRPRARERASRDGRDAS